jgi:8-oxo-dGTP pyrophosphatase MutT (NUDIX family)
MQQATWDGLPVSDQPPFGASVVVWRRKPEREVLLLHRAVGGPDFEGDWAWTPPSGARLPGEAIDETARRELREETGLELECVAIGASDEWAVYLAEAPPDAAAVLGSEHDGFEWVTVEKALARCRPASVRDGLAAAVSWLGLQASR